VDIREVASTASARRHPTGEFTFGALAVGGIVVLAIGNGLSSGEPALTLLAAFGVALIVLGVSGAVWALHDVSVVLSAPADAAVGSEVAIEVELQRRGAREPTSGCACEVRLLDPPTEWHSAFVGERGTLRWRAPRRGVVSALRVEVRSSWPFGMFQRRRVFVVALPDRLHVIPRPIAMPYLPRATSGDGVQARASVAQPGDLVRSVRPYQAGDPQRLVHWPSTARTGELMLREFEPPATHGVAVRLVLVRDPALAEPAAGRAYGFGQSVLRSRHALLLMTREAGGDVVGPVATERELGRRLARAVAGEPADAADTADASVIELR
jgi:uncharacterized protein (DUF58 family)